MTQKFIRPEVPIPATAAWLVHQVGDDVEIVHVGPSSPDSIAAIERLGAKFAAIAARPCVALAGDVPEVVTGLRIAGGDADDVWRTLQTFGEETSKIDNRRVLLGFTREAYIAIARRAGIK